jgi:phage gp29-like protein
LTPARVLSFLHAADAGSPQMQFELFGEMLQKWPRLAAVEATRRLALTGLDWEVEAADSSAQAVEAAEYCRTTLATLDRFRDALDHLANAIGYGIAVAELVWEDGRLSDVVPVPYSRLISDANEPWRLRVRTEEDPSVGVALDQQPNKWVVHQPRATPGRAFEGGMLRASVLLYVAQNLSFKDWLIYSQIAGMPVRVGRFEPGTPESDKQQLLKMLESLGTDAVAILSKNIELQLLETRGGDKPYQPLQEHCNTEVTILWLGQHLTTDLRGERLGLGVEPPRRQERQVNTGFGRRA